jgi:superfamily I DNA and/or RNA helicase
VNRLDEAVRTLLSGGTANHHLIDILMDLSQAVFEQEEEISSYYQSALAEDKKRAVKKALAARDLFLLQGPPGTGKTTALAELILQILDRQPDARILVTSQSNVAVDHILLKVAEVARERGIEMVRIGRADKIGAGAEIWTIEQRQANWRTTILSRTEPKLTALNAQVQELRRQRKQRQTQNPEETAVLEQWKTRMDELGPELQAMEEDERHREELIRYSQAFQPLAEARQEMEEEEEQCRIRLEERKARIMAVLTQLCAVLAETDEAIQQGKLIEEYQRLGQIVLKRLGIEPEEAAAEQWIQFLKDWRAVAGIGEAFAEPLLARASILAATCLATGREAFRDRRFDWAIIDEAGRATAPELLVPLVRARRAILVGDERQLPPMVDSELSEKELASVGVSRESLTESLFGTLVKEAQEAHLPIVQMLTAQHRMHPAIGRLISEVFYEGKLEHAVTEQERRHELTWVPKCIVWYTTTRLSQHEETPRGSSFSNRVEVDRCLMLLRQMETDYRALDQRREVAVISPYNAQIAELRAAIRPGGPDWHALHIVIAAVDAFQGKDSDIVLYSLVRSNQQARLGFLRDERRLNVALSRARQLLLLIGDLWTLENGRAGSEAENPYRRLITYLREHEEDCAIEHLEEI